MLTQFFLHLSNHTFSNSFSSYYLLMLVPPKDQHLELFCLFSLRSFSQQSLLILKTSSARSIKNFPKYLYSSDLFPKFQFNIFTFLQDISTPFRLYHLSLNFVIYSPFLLATPVFPYLLRFGPLSYL